MSTSRKVRTDEHGKRTINLKIKEGVIVVDGASGRSESQYLIRSNREKCKEIFSKTQWKHSELIDGYIALHMVMEAGLNNFFRQLALKFLKKGVSEISVMKNVDEISFRHKVTLFIYNSKFNFNGKLDEATKYHKIIGELKNFCEIRNQLIHGSAIATVFDSDNPEPTHTTARKKIMSGAQVKEHLKRFRFIMDGMNFYVDCLEDLTQEDKDRYKRDFLGYDFLPNSEE